MTPKQVKQLTDRRDAWWQTRLNDGVRESVWEPALVDILPDVAVEAMKRYARKQRNSQPPSLEDLLAACEDVQDERHRASIQQRRQEEDRQAMEAWQKSWQGRLPEPRTTGDVLHDTLASAARDPWAWGHVELVEKGFNKPGREQDAASFCRTKARDDAANELYWYAEAVWWTEGANGRAGWSLAMREANAERQRVLSGMAPIREPGWESEEDDAEVRS